MIVRGGDSSLRFGDFIQYVHTIQERREEEVTRRGVCFTRFTSPRQEQKPGFAFPSDAGGRARFSFC